MACCMQRRCAQVCATYVLPKTSQEASRANGNGNGSVVLRPGAIPNRPILEVRCDATCSAVLHAPCACSVCARNSACISCVLCKTLQRVLGTALSQKCNAQCSYRVLKTSRCARVTHAGRQAGNSSTWQMLERLAQSCQGPRAADSLRPAYIPCPSGTTFQVPDWEQQYKRYPGPQGARSGPTSGLRIFSGTSNPVRLLGGVGRDRAVPGVSDHIDGMVLRICVCGFQAALGSRCWGREADNCLTDGVHVVHCGGCKQSVRCTGKKDMQSMQSLIIGFAKSGLPQSLRCCW